MAVGAGVTTQPGLSAGADLSAKKFYWVKYASTAGQVIVVAATTDLAVGVLQNAPDAAGKPAEVQVSGIVKVMAGTSVGWSASIAVGWNSTGKAVPLAANSTNDNRVYGGRFVLGLGQTGTVTINQIISVRMLGAVQRL